MDIIQIEVRQVSYHYIPAPNGFLYMHECLPHESSVTKNTYASMGNTIDSHFSAAPVRVAVRFSKDFNSAVLI